MAEVSKSINNYIWEGDEMFDLLIKIRNEEGDLKTVEIEAAGYEGCEVEVTWSHTETEEETIERMKRESVASIKNAETYVRAQEEALAVAKKRLENIKKERLPF